MRLHKFAPVSFPNIIRSEPDLGAEGQQRSSSTSISSKDTEYPVCWFQDDDTQFALRWHLFVGVLWDMKATKSIPWKIRLHFTQYPTSQILPLENCVLTTIEHKFMNSLKQALFMQYGSSKVAMNMTKQTHERVWDSIVTSNYQLYQEVNDNLQQTNESSMNILPVRLMVDSKPPIQRPCRISKGELIHLFCVLLVLSCAFFLAQSILPSRVRFINKSDESVSLGSLLLDWSPELFQKDADGVVQPKSSNVSWSVQGINVPLSASIVDLWKSLCCPDHFLYILLLTR
jgi:autophagy-related protein 5